MKLLSILCCSVRNLGENLTFHRGPQTQFPVATYGAPHTFTCILFVFPLDSRGLFHKEGFWHITVASAVESSLFPTTLQLISSSQSPKGGKFLLASDDVITW